MIEAKEDVYLMVDYLLCFRNKKGLLSAKVYKLKKLKIRKGNRITLKKRHPFRANITTHKFYVGEGDEVEFLLKIGRVFSHENTVKWEHVKQ